MLNKWQQEPVCFQHLKLSHTLECLDSLVFSLLSFRGTAPQMFAVSAHYNLARMACISLHAWYGSRRKWLPHLNVSNSPCEALQMIIISNKMTAAIQPCPPSKIYAAKSGIQATTTVVQLCAAFSGHTLKGLAEARQQGINCSCMQS